MLAATDLNAWWAGVSFRSNSSTRRALWLRLAKMLSANVPILKAVQELHGRRQKSKGANDPVTLALADIAKQISAGETFGDSLTMWVPPGERMLVAAGERAGQLPQNLVKLARIIRVQQQILGTVYKGLAYPVFLTFCFFVMAFFFSYTLIPTFAKAAPAGKTFTGIGRMVIVTADMLRVILPYFTGVCVALVVAFIASLPRWDGQMRIWADRHAPYAIYRMIQGSMWLTSLAAMLESGERLPEALRQMARNASPWLLRRINAALAGINAGHDIGEALKRAGHDFPDAEIVEDLAIYGVLGGFNEALSRLSEEWIMDGEEQVKTVMNVVFGVALFVVGGSVMFFVGGMIDMQLQLATALQVGH